VCAELESVELMADRLPYDPRLGYSTDESSFESDATVEGSLGSVAESKPESERSDSEEVEEGDSDSTIEGVLEVNVSSDSLDSAKQICPRFDSTIVGELDLDSSDCSLDLSSGADTDTNSLLSTNQNASGMSNSTDSDIDNSNKRHDSDTDGSGTNTNKPVEHDQGPAPLVQNKERAVVANILASACCSKECLSHLTIHLLTNSRAKVQALGQSERKQWIVTKIADNAKIMNRKLDVRFFIGGSEICRVAFQIIYSISPKTISRSITMVENGQLVVEHGNRGTNKPSEKVLNARSWMMQYFKLVGDKMPNKEQTHIPSWDSRKAIYTRYQDDMKEEFKEEAEQHTISLSNSGNPNSHQLLSLRYQSITVAKCFTVVISVAI